MGILRSREELLPVTCAVIKEDEREAFFNDVRRKVGGNMDRVAKTVGVPVSTLQDWVNGTSNVPYITLQRLSSEFGVPMPSVGELRREYQQIAAPQPPRRPPARLP
ncbi:MAG: helix-turn-helix transcriptional regulator, partial [Elusimicrobia bacterium]|nr:helix-turn-helix transcriptional regulator [Elusimicrobiota bacterium]